MDDGLRLAAWLALHLLIGFTGTWAARRYALRRNLMDQPGERRSHSQATPRGGGIAIVVSMLVVATAGAWWHPQYLLPLALAGTGVVLVAGIGWLDDHRALSPWSRLGVHALSAALLAAGVATAGGTALDALLAFCAALVLTNVWNFMDGIDGLAASQAALAAAAFAMLAQGPLLYAGLGLAAACLGFLPHNFPKARIFLGDVGSGSLGYTLAVLMVATALVRPDPQGGWLLLLLPLAVFMLDASLTLGMRVLRGERWWEPHVQHAYQAWARRSGHQTVTWSYAIATFTAIMLMFALRSSGAPLRLVIMTGFGLAGGVAWTWLRRRQAGAGP